ncbi:MAG: hypothetical protein WAL76_10070, partial [Candidatus Sulfotelmatobacter sp.]
YAALKRRSSTVFPGVWLFLRPVILGVRLFLASETFFASELFPRLVIPCVSFTHWLAVDMGAECSVDSV